MTTTLNGPTCSGKVVGNFVRTPMKVGDIAVIPAGVPHGWSDIPTEVTYLSVRPDPKHVLPKAGFVYPGSGREVRSGSARKRATGPYSKARAQGGQGIDL